MTESPENPAAATETREADWRVQIASLIVGALLTLLAKDGDRGPSGRGRSLKVRFGKRAFGKSRWRGALAGFSGRAGPSA